MKESHQKNWRKEMSKAITELKIETVPRSEGLNPRQIRTSGFLPATLYGKGIASKSLQIKAHDFKLIYRDNKEAAFDLVVDGKKISAIVQDVQMNYSTGEYLNVEFKSV